MTLHVDIAIAGAGPVGMATAAMLIRRGVDATQIALIDAKPPGTTTDPRSIAISHGSRQLLEQIDAWPRTATAIRQIHVSRRGSFGRTLIDADDYSLPALGYVCGYGDLVQALAARLTDKALREHRPAQIIEAIEDHNQVAMTLSDGSLLSSSVLVQAEGGVFGAQPQRLLHRDYQQCAIISVVCSSHPPSGRAFERFTEQGPLALLPQEDAYSLVWCVRPETADQFMALENNAFLKVLQQAFGQRTGIFTRIGQRACYPLGLNAHRQPSPRKIAIGNASQTLHPVAGQGLNLGLRDAAVLADLLSKTMDTRQLNHFHAQRATDRGVTVRLTDLMARLFASSADQSPLQHALGLSLALLDLTPRVRQGLAEQMMYGQR